MPSSAAAARVRPPSPLPSYAPAQAYPWYTTVRRILDDPMYAPWFIMFSQTGPWTSPKCDNFYSPPLCTEFFHTQMDTPRPDTHGYGRCSPPAGRGCDCGTKPCGFYVFNHSSTAVINGQTFREWFIDSYVLDSIGMDADVSGFFFDDFWSPTGNMGDNTANATRDMGLTPADLQQLTADYTATMAALDARVLSAGKFSWQMLWTGGAKGSTCPGPLVRAAPAGCAADLALLCAPGAPPQTEALMYAFSPGGCGGDPSKLPNAAVDIANFLLIRGPHAWIGNGWKACSRTYAFPEALNTDVGTPLGLCAPTGAPGVFAREYTNVRVEMDCNTGVPTITPRA